MNKNDEMLAIAEALEEFAMIDEAEGGNPLVIATERRAAELLRSTREAEPVANKDEQRTICEACGNSNIAHDRAVWTDDGSAFCPPCHPSPSTEGLGVRVKGLGWSTKNPIRDNGDIRAHSAVGLYEIGKVGGRVLVMLRLIKKGDAEDIDVGSFDTFDGAKAAAQADYESRILSALEPSGIPGELPALSASAEQVGFAAEAQFLIDRLDDFERGSLGDSIEDACRDFDGHVSPAIERLRDALQPNQVKG